MKKEEKVTVEDMNEAEEAEEPVKKPAKKPAAKKPATKKKAKPVASDNEEETDAQLE